jgi:hypothetical protein
MAAMPTGTLAIFASAMLQYMTEKLGPRRMGGKPAAAVQMGP